jgi:hypothetical protein
MINVASLFSAPQIKRRRCDVRDMRPLRKFIFCVLAVACTAFVRSKWNAVEHIAPAHSKSPTPSEESAEKIESVYAIKRVYELALKQREFEIAQLTQRNNFFMIFQGVLIAGLVQSQGTAAPVINFLVCLIGMCVSICQIGMAGGAKFWQIRWEVAVKELELRLFEAMQDSPRKMIQLFTVDGRYLSESEIKRINAINERPARKDDQLGYIKGAVANLVREDFDNGRGEPKSMKARLLTKSPLRFAVLHRFSVSKIPLWIGLFLFLFWFLLWLNTFFIGAHSPLGWLNSLLPKDLVQLKSFR